jgi:hypothetical protein
MCSNEIITNLYKLIYETKNYSFDNLIATAKKEKHISVQEDFKYFEEELIHIKNQFELLDIKKMRDKYIAHLDKDRKAIKYYLSEINTLITHIEHSYKVLFRAIKNEDVTWDYNNDALSILIEDISELKKFLEKEKI